jgi:uncharacterized phage infection (PIP) family protein YhgE
MLESRKKRVRDLYFVEGKNTREIAIIERMSIRDILNILKEEAARKQDLEDESQKRLEGRLSADAYTLFEKGKTPVDVVIKLELEGPQVTKFYKEYLRLKSLPEVVSLCDEIADDAKSYLELYKLANSSGMSNKEVVTAVDTALNKLPSAVENYFQTTRKVNESIEMEQDLSDHIKVLRGEKSLLIHEISDLKVQEHNLVECSNRKNEEIEELQKEQQQIENTMNKYQHMVICKFAGAIHIVLDTFAMKLTRAIEIREMYKGDIAE